MSNRYYYLRFRWWKAVTLEEIKEQLGSAFQIQLETMPTSETDISLHKDDREEFVVVADTLTARLSRFRAILQQKEAASFTAKDMELRKKVLELYPRHTPTPFPWEFSTEPKFQVA